MSYDFHLISRKAGSDLLVAAQSHLEAETDQINPGPPVPEKEARKRRLVQSLKQQNPSLEPFQFGFAEIAKKYRISEDEARVRYRHVELNGPEDGNGIQIVLYDDTASITFPFWHGAEAALGVVNEIWRYLEILEKEGSLATYDPQLEKILDLKTDMSIVLERYGKVVAKMPQMVAAATKATRPWWKLW